MFQEQAACQWRFKGEVVAFVCWALAADLVVVQWWLLVHFEEQTNLMAPWLALLLRTWSLALMLLLGQPVQVFVPLTS